MSSKQSYSPIVPPSADPTCPSTAQQVLVNGANAVCGVPAPHAARDDRSGIALGLSASLAIAFAFALMHRQGLSPKRIAILLLAAAAVAAPGLRAVWMDRADAPMHASETSKKVVALVDEMDTFASERGECLQEVRNECEECQPLVRFVLPVHTACAHPRGRIELRRNALATGCVVQGDTLECGSTGRL